MRESKTRYAILGLLAWRPMSGYDMKKSIGESLGHFWGESYGQIYPILRELTRDGLATKSVERQVGRPDRHVYSITEAGRSAFLGWLSEPPEPARFRVEALLKLFYGQHGSLSQSIGHVRHLRAQQEAQLQHYSALPDGIRERFPDDPNLPFWLITLRCGVYVSQAFIDWCDEAEPALARLAADTDGRTALPEAKEEHRCA